MPDPTPAPRALHVIDTTGPDWCAIADAAHAIRDEPRCPLVFAIGALAPSVLQHVGISADAHAVPPFARAELAWPALRRFARSCGPLEAVHAWSLRASLAVRLARPAAPLTIHLHELPDHRASRWMRTLAAADSLTAMGAPIRAAWRAAGLPAEINCDSSAAVASKDLLPADQPAARAARRDEWGTDDETLVIHASSEPASAIGAFAESYIAGVVRITGRRSMIVVPPGARELERAVRLAHTHAREWRVITDPRPPWELLPGCDLALYIDSRPKDPSARHIAPAPSPAPLLYAAAFNIPIVAQDTAVVQGFLSAAGARATLVPDSDFTNGLNYSRAILRAMSSRESLSADPPCVK